MIAPTERAWYAAAALAGAIFATYVTLVPFQFAPPAPGTSILAFLWDRAEIGVVSRGNGLANIVLFVPIGFFGLAALVGHRSSPAKWPLAIAAVLLSSAAVSISIEVLQAFVPGRTPSLTDVVAQAIGSTIGMALWPLLGGQVRTWIAALSAGHSTALGLGLVVYVGVLLIYLVLPLDVTVDLGALARKYRTGMIVLNPLHSRSLGVDNLPAAIADFVMAVPAGVLAVIGWRGGARNRAFAACALVVVFFGCAEAAQVFVRSRTADTLDFLVNVMGAAAGVLLTIQLAHGRGSHGRAHRRRVLARALAVMTGLYVVYNWSPFDFTWSSAMVDARASRLWAVPFAGYYQNAEFKALSDATIKLCLSAPFGILIQMLIGRPARSAASIAVVAAAAIFFAVVEAGQLLLPSRFPDNTDVLLATGGVLAAMHLTRRFQAAPFPEILPIRRAVPVVLAADSRLVWRTPSGGEIRKRRRRRPESRRAE